MSAASWRGLIQSLMPQLWPNLIHGEWWIEGLVHVESDGNPIARSSTGASGLMQLEPATAAEMGVADPDDPEQNLRGGIKYLHSIYDSLLPVCTRSTRLFWSLAGYNCGPAFVRRALDLAVRDDPGYGWMWQTGRFYLFHWRNVTVSEGEPPLHADYMESWRYVDAISLYVRKEFMGGGEDSTAVP